MKAQQEKAENALKKWKKDKIETHKRGASRKISKRKRGSSSDNFGIKPRMGKMPKVPKVNKKLALYQTGKAIVFQ